VGRGGVKEKATGFIVFLRLLWFTIVKWQKKKATGFGEPMARKRC
jgi:hypothetical protein